VAVHAQGHNHVMQTVKEAQWGPAPPFIPAGAEIAVLSGDPTNTEWRELLDKIIDAQLVFHKEESRTLSDAVRLYVGRSHENAHSALADAEATALVIAGQLGRYPQMPRTPGEVAARYPPPRGRRIDPEGKLVTRGGTVYVNFGKKHHGKSFDQVRGEDPHFFDWILSGDFSPSVKRCVRDYLTGRAQGVIPFS